MRSNANTDYPAVRRIPGSVKVNNAERSPELSPPPPPDVPGSYCRPGGCADYQSFTLKPQDLPLRLNFDSPSQVAVGRVSGWTQADSILADSGTSQSFQTLPEIPLNSCKKLFTSVLPMQAMRKTSETREPSPEILGVKGQQSRIQDSGLELTADLVSSQTIFIWTTTIKTNLTNQIHLFNNFQQSRQPVSKVGVCSRFLPIEEFFEATVASCLPLDYKVIKSSRS